MSDISFSKLTWENLPARTTALSATNLNRIENGIADSVNGANSNSHSIAELQTRISQMSGGVMVDSFGTNGWEEVENNYFTTDRGDNTTGVCKVFKQGGWAMVLIDGRIIANPSGWQTIGKVEKAFSLVPTNALTNTGGVVRLRVTTNGAVQMSYFGTVPALIGTTFFYPMAVT